MSPTRQSPALLALASLLTAPLAAPSSAQEQAKPDLCATESVKTSDDPVFLQSVKRDCSGDAWTAALTKLFALPLPPARQLRLAPPVPMSNAEQATLEVDLYYQLADPYPPPEAIARIDALLQRVERAFEVRSVHITGSVDHRELKTELASVIATRRARKVESYIRSAGIAPTTPIQVAVSEPSHSDDDEGNARDRSVRVRIVALRAKAQQ